MVSPEEQVSEAGPLFRSYVKTSSQVHGNPRTTPTDIGLFPHMVSYSAANAWTCHLAFLYRLG